MEQTLQGQLEEGESEVGGGGGEREGAGERAEEGEEVLYPEPTAAIPGGREGDKLSCQNDEEFEEFSLQLSVG